MFLAVIDRVSSFLEVHFQASLALYHVSFCFYMLTFILYMLHLFLHMLQLFHHMLYIIFICSSRDEQYMHHWLMYFLYMLSNLASFFSMHFPLLAGVSCSSSQTYWNTFSAEWYVKFTNYKCNLIKNMIPSQLVYQLQEPVVAASSLYK